jgi:uncharacterized membrane protein
VSIFPLFSTYRYSYGLILLDFITLLLLLLIIITIIIIIIIITIQLLTTHFRPITKTAQDYKNTQTT